MATYYVSSTGDDANDGLSSGTAWLTLAHALTQILSTDTLSIAAGSYPATGLGKPAIGKVYANGYIFNGTDPAAGAAVNYRLVSPPVGDGAIYEAEQHTATADDSGFISVELWAGAEYLFWRGRGEQISLTTTSASPVAIPQLISASSANN